MPSAIASTSNNHDLTYRLLSSSYSRHFQNLSGPPFLHVSRPFNLSISSGRRAVLLEFLLCLTASTDTFSRYLGNAEAKKDRSTKGKHKNKETGCAGYRTRYTASRKGRTASPLPYLCQERQPRKIFTFARVEQEVPLSHKGQRREGEGRLWSGAGDLHN
jgi:hypothetical protein